MISSRTIDAMLDAMTEIVDDDTMPWAAKRDRIRAACKEHERYALALEELTSWFDGEKW